MSIPIISGSSTGSWKSLVNTVIAAINTAFNKRPYVWADSTARLAQTGMTVGEYGRQTDTGVEYRATSATATKAWNSDWITYTPTLTGFAVGTGGSAAAVTRYRYTGGMVEVSWKFILGTTGTTLPATPTFTLPVAAVAQPHSFSFYPGGGDVFDSSATKPLESGIISDGTSTTVARIWYRKLTGDGYDYPVSASTLPWVWAAGDAMQGRATYEPA